MTENDDNEKGAIYSRANGHWKKIFKDRFLCTKLIIHAFTRASLMRMIIYDYFCVACGRNNFYDGLACDWLLVRM